MVDIPTTSDIIAPMQVLSLAPRSKPYNKASFIKQVDKIFQFNKAIDVEEGLRAYLEGWAIGELFMISILFLTIIYVLSSVIVTKVNECHIQRLRSEVLELSRKLRENEERNRQLSRRVEENEKNTLGTLKSLGMRLDSLGMQLDKVKIEQSMEHAALEAGTASGLQKAQRQLELLARQLELLAGKVYTEMMKANQNDNEA